VNDNGFLKNIDLILKKIKSKDFKKVVDLRMGMQGVGGGGGNAVIGQR
jgi:hypothetical protein